MIRRHMGKELYLIPQHQHALLSGRLAAHFGNDLFAPPDPAEQTIQAASLHDSGWALHDECPTLNKEHYPLDVFETPVQLAVQVWRASVDRAAKESDYTQLLVSLHVLGLSGYAASRPHTRKEIFELNKFQQHEIERQENLRRRLGLPTDTPLLLGLADKSPVPAEQQLRHNHGIIQIADRISLALCCTTMLFPQIEGITPRPGAGPLILNLKRPNEYCLEVEPWPFDKPVLTVSTPYRAVPNRPYTSEEEFRRVYAESPTRMLEFTVRWAK